MGESSGRGPPKRARGSTSWGRRGWIVFVRVDFLILAKERRYGDEIDG